jgi:PmbA protein
LSGTETVRRALDRALKAGAHSGDAVLVEGDGIEARVRGDEVEHVKQARERTLGIRVFVEGPGGLRQAITSTSDLDPKAVDRMAEETVALARNTAVDAHAGLPADGFATDLPDLGLIDETDRGIAVADHIGWARAAEQAARAVDPRIVNSDGSTAGSDFGQIYVANTAGFEGSYASAGHSLFCMPIASQNGAMETAYWTTVARRVADLEGPEAVGRRAAQRALESLGAKRVATAEVPVLFDNMTARSLLSNLASCVSGSAIYRKSSYLAGRLGEAVASPKLTVVDDGRRPGGLGSKPFDGEGLPTGRTVVLQDGVLESYLLDSYSARKLDMQSTGNASRSAGSAPGVGPSNLWIEPGETDLEAMVQNTGRGLLVTWLFGHGFNPVTGDFSRGARGFWIEGGERVQAVEEITVAGNLGDMLRDVDLVANDLHWMGSVASPSLRVAQMTVAGT